MRKYLSFLLSFIIIIPMIIMLFPIRASAEEYQEISKGVLEIYESENKILRTYFPNKIKIESHFNNIAKVTIIGPHEILITGRQSGRILLNNTSLQVSNIIAVKKITLSGNKTNVTMYTGIENLDESPVNVEIKWKRLSSADGYLVYREKANGEKEYIKKIEDANITSYTDPDVFVHNPTCYYVQGYKELDDGTTVYSLFGECLIYE